MTIAHRGLKRKVIVKVKGQRSRSDLDPWLRAVFLVDDIFCRFVGTQVAIVTDGRTDRRS